MHERSGVVVVAVVGLPGECVLKFRSVSAPALAAIAVTPPIYDVMASLCVCYFIALSRVV